MALIVENGTGLAAAESYISVADADAYHVARANTAWTGDAPTKEAALRKATDYMVQAYRLKWRGTAINATMALDWPRDSAQMGGRVVGTYWPTDEVPLRIAQACAELGLRALSGQLEPDTERQVKREKIDVLEVEYSDGPVNTVFTAVEKMLSEFVRGANVNIPLVRA